MPSINYYVCSFRPVTMMNYNDCTMWDIHHLANSLSLGRESKMFLYCLFLNNGPFWFPVQLKENLKLVWPVHVLPVIPQSLKASCKNTKATTLNFSLSRAAGILERQSRDLGLQFPFSQTSSRQKNQGKKTPSFMDIWGCMQDVNFVKCPPWNQWAEPNRPPIFTHFLSTQFSVVSPLSLCSSVNVWCLLFAAQHTAFLFADGWITIHISD